MNLISVRENEYKDMAIQYLLYGEVKAYRVMKIA